MSYFPSWWHLGDSTPVLYHTAEQVPPGWTRCEGRYDAEIGQWVDDPVDKTQAPAEKVDANDLPAIAGFVRDGFDMDAPGYPPRTPATVEPADKVVAKEPRKRRKSRNAKATKSLKGKAKTAGKGSTKMSDQKETTNDPNAPIDKPQPNESPARPDDDSNTAKERGNDGTVRTGNRPTVR